MERKNAQLGDVLLHSSVISHDQLKEALMVQEKTGERLGRIIIKLGYASPEKVAQALAQQQGLEFVEISKITISPDVIKLVPYDLCKKYNLIPLGSFIEV